MSLWDDRFRDFGGNCIKNWQGQRPDAARAGTEVTLDIQTCLSLFVVLNENENKAKHGEENPLPIDRRKLGLLVDKCVDTTVGDSTDAATYIRHAFAHFNIELMSTGHAGEIGGLRLTSYKQDEKTHKWTVLRWQGEVSAEKLKLLVDGLAELWPKSS